MLQGMLIKKVLDLVLKQIFKKFDLDKMKKYVEEENELDKQIAVFQKKMTKYGKIMEQMENDIAKLKSVAHTPISDLTKRLKKLEKNN